MQYSNINNPTSSLPRSNKKRKVNENTDSTHIQPSPINTSNGHHDYEKYFSRFEAYKRCTVAGSDALSNFISACLIHSSKATSNRKMNNLSLIGGMNASRTCTNSCSKSNNNNGNDSENNNVDAHDAKHDNSESKTTTSSSSAAGSSDTVTARNMHQNKRGTDTFNQQNVINDTNSDKNNKHMIINNPIDDNNIASISTLQLPDIVAPGSASRITSLVSTLAKIHAQRLVKSARDIATAQGYNEEDKILPHHLMEAHRIMSQYGSTGTRGGSSGGGSLFMQPMAKKMKGLSNHSMGRSGSLDGHHSIALGGANRNLIQYQAALEAQEKCNDIMNQSISRDFNMDEEVEEKKTVDKHSTLGDDTHNSEKLQG